MPWQDKFEATSDTARRMHPSSDMGVAKLELTVHEQPQPASATLPELYNVDSFEFLIVDPEFAFASWEITPATLAAAEAQLGAAFGSRALQLRLYASGSDGPALAGFNLFGDSGRWFLRGGVPGQAVTAILGFAAGSEFYELQRRGPVSFPRNAAVDAERYAELQVTYELGPQGQLILAGLNRPQPHRWPASLSPAAVPPVPLDYLDGQPGWADGISGPGTSSQRAAQRVGGVAGGPSSTSLSRTREGGTSDV